MCVCVGHLVSVGVDACADSHDPPPPLLPLMLLPQRKLLPAHLQAINVSDGGPALAKGHLVLRFDGKTQGVLDWEEDPAR